VHALVTGGAGFIGSTLTDRLLAEGHRVDVVDDLTSGSLANLAVARTESARQLSFHQMDVRSDALVGLMDRRRPDVVFHLAARRGASPAEAAHVAVVGTVQVLEGAVAAGSGKVVMASDRSADSRAAGEYLQAYREGHDLEFTALVLGSVYGPRQRAGVVAEFAARMLAGKPCTIVGDGRQTRDFVFVDDVVDALARATDRGDGLVLDVGTGRQTAVRDLFAEMAAIADVDHSALSAPGPTPDRGHGHAPGEAGSSVFDPARAAIHLGWRPWTDLATGLATMLRPSR